MGQKVSRTDFEWLNDVDQPHMGRRREILKAHPEIKSLMSHDPSFKWTCSAVVLFQFISIPIVAQLPWWLVIVGAYCVGGLINHSLMLAIHEIAHAAPFGFAHPRLNAWFGAFTSLPMCVPIAPSFKKYHLEHHKFLGVDTKDPDLPTKFEAVLFCTTFGKVIWLFLQPLFYVIRPLVVDPKVPSLFEIGNVIVQVIFDFLVVYLFGWKPLVYLLGGGILAMGLHPMAAHFIAEHYMFKKGFETYSYYGPWNLLGWNVGYHNEHHDFPNIPHSKLPLITKMAPEFYEHLPQHSSWPKVIWDWIFDPAIGPYTRVKRELARLEEAKRNGTPQWQLTGIGGPAEKEEREQRKEEESSKAPDAGSDEPEAEPKEESGVREEPCDTVIAEKTFIEEAGQMRRRVRKDNLKEEKGK